MGKKMKKEMLPKKFETKFDEVSDILDDVTQVDGVDGDRYQIDREFEEDNGNSVTEWVDLRVNLKNKKINVAITQETLYHESDSSKGIQKTKKKLENIKTLIENNKDCRAEIRDDFDGKPHILSITCSKDKDIDINKKNEDITKEINLLSIDIMREKVPFEKEFED